MMLGLPILASRDHSEVLRRRPATDHSDLQLALLSLLCLLKIYRQVVGSVWFMGASSGSRKGGWRILCPWLRWWEAAVRGRLRILPSVKIISNGNFLPDEFWDTDNQSS